MKLGIPITNRALLPLAALALSALVGLVLLLGPAFSPVEGAEEHSRIYFSDCAGTVNEEGPTYQVIGTVATTEHRPYNLAYHLDMVDGTAESRRDYEHKWGVIVTGNPSALSIGIWNDNHLDDGETFVAIVGSSSDDLGQNPDQRCVITIRDNDPPRVRDIRLVSRPADRETYRRGEKIEIEVEFDNKVHVVGVPAVPVWVTDHPKGIFWAAPEDPSDIKQATYVSGNNTKVLKFAYEVQAGDRDSRGLVVPLLERNSLGKGTVKWALGERYADHSTNDAFRGPKVNGR